MILNDNESRGEIHPLAKAQLEPYVRLAATWGRYPDGRAVRCAFCGQAMFFITDPHGAVYGYSDAERLALVTAHIRQRHAEAVSEPK